MIPRETTIVAPSIGGPDTVTTFAPRMAKYCGSPPCACTPGGWRKRNPTAAKPSVSAHRWSSSKRMRIPQLQDFEGETDLSNRRMRLLRSFHRVKNKLPVLFPATSCLNGISQNRAGGKKAPGKGRNIDRKSVV